LKLYYLISLVSILFVPNAFADATDDFVDNLEEPVNIEVEILLNNVIDVDRVNGNYKLDFWFSVYSDDVDFTTIAPPEFDFTNGMIEDVSSVYVEEHYMEQRVRGTFFNKLDFHDFPFEVITLKVVAEPVRPWTIGKTTLHIAPTSGIDVDANIPGYHLDSGKFHIETHSYESEEETYERYVASFLVEKSSLGSFLKVVFPVLIVVAISFVAYIVPENFEVVAAIALLPLVAVVFLHVNTLDELPPLGYLTTFDKMMVIVYAMIANNIVSTGRQMRAHVFKHEQGSWTVNMFHLKISPVIAGILIVILFALL